MRNIFTIMKKDVSGFFHSPSFYISAFLCAAIFSWVYPIQLVQFDHALKNSMFQQGGNSQQLNIHYSLFIRHLSYLNLLLILVVPAMTMRLFAEEKKLHTFDLLLTSPVTSFEIVAGKYLAGLAAVLGIIFLSFLYPLITATFADVNWATLLTAYLGIFFVAAVYTAMNLFCSSLTESALVAFVMAVILNISIWFVGIAVEIVDSSMWRQVFEHISLNTHLSGMIEGTIRTSALVFFLSVIFLFCFLSERVVESSRWR